jgi:hypothetical protein
MARKIGRAFHMNRKMKGSAMRHTRKAFIAYREVSFGEADLPAYPRDIVTKCASKAIEATCLIGQSVESTDQSNNERISGYIARQKA